MSKAHCARQLWSSWPRQLDGHRSGGLRPDSCETLQDGFEPGNLKYREMFFNPTLHTARGIPMATVIDGLIEGAKAAETDFGVRCAFIADVYRQDPPPVAARWWRRYSRTVDRS
ncbi:MAG TPA: hypothetical protein VGP05_18305 [Pseudonocardia sp.]|nr:hypothetical protein [Pseudonocardia sp.]